MPRYYRVRAAIDPGRAVVGSLGALLGQRRYKLRHVEDGFELIDRDPDRVVAAMEEHFQIWHEGSRKAEEGADPAGLDSPLSIPRAAEIRGSRSS